MNPGVTIFGRVQATNPSSWLPHNYNLRNAEDTDSDPIETEETVQEIHTNPIKYGRHLFKLDVFRGDVTDKVEDFLKSSDQYVSIVQIKKQQLDVLLYHL